MEHIYPECPDCGEKASRGDGVDLDDVVKPEFKWVCPACETLHRGTFVTGVPTVMWKASRPLPLYRRILRAVRFW